MEVAPNHWMSFKTDQSFFLNVSKASATYANGLTPKIFEGTRKWKKMTK